MSEGIIRHFPPGKRANGLILGDLILVHGLSLVPKLIQLGQRIQFRGERRTYAFYNHVACYAGISDQEPVVIEAKGRRPVRYVPLSQYDVRHYAVVHINATPQGRTNAIKFLKAQLGDKYANLSIFGVALWALTGGKLTFGYGNTWFCSELGAAETARLGVFYSEKDASLTPAHIAEHFGVAAP